MLNYVSHSICALPILAIRTFLVQVAIDPNMSETRALTKYVQMLAHMTHSSTCLQYHTTLDPLLAARVEEMVARHGLSKDGWEEESNNVLCEDEELLDFITRNDYAVHSCGEALNRRQCHILLSEPVPTSLSASSGLSGSLRRVIDKQLQFSSSVKNSQGRKMKILYPDYFSVTNLFELIGYANRSNLTDQFELYVASYDKSLLEDIGRKVKQCLPSTAAAADMIKLLIVISPEQGLFRSLEQFYSGADLGAMKYDYIDFAEGSYLSEENLKDEAELTRVKQICYFLFLFFVFF
jgi:hypothetical protein